MTSSGASPLWQLEHVNVTTEPLLAGDVLVVSAESLHGLNIYDGSRSWTPIEHDQPINSIAAAGGTVFLLGDPSDWDDASLVAFDASTGKRKKWTADVPSDAQLQRLRVESGVLVASDSLGFVHGLDCVTGKQLWKTQISDATPQDFAAGDDAVFGLANDVVKAVNVLSGQQRWQFPDPSKNDPRYLLVPDDSLGSDTTLYAGRGIVLVNGAQAVYALDWKLGAALWTIAIPEHEVWNSPVVSPDGAYLFVTPARQGTAHGYALSQSGPREFWSSSSSISEPGGFLRPVVESDVPVIEIASGKLQTESLVFLPANSGNVYVISVQAGAEGQPPKPRMQPIVANGAGLLFPPVVANGALFMTGAGTMNTVNAVPFAAEWAPRFRRDASPSISVPDDPNHPNFDFGAGGFSLEAWVRTTAGGQVITRACGASQDESGFRLEIVNGKDVNCSDYGEGRVVFTIGNASYGPLLFAQTDPTAIADGIWHHLAVVRQGNAITIFIDGISHAVTHLVSEWLVSREERKLLPSGSSYFGLSRLGGTIAVPAVTSHEPVVIGAYLVSHAETSDLDAKPFDGMIRDVRLWNTKLTASQIHDRMAKELTGHEPGLVAYLPLGQPLASELKNLCSDQVPAVLGIESKPTNLVLDDGLWPYLINHLDPQWPNSERWLARGEDEPAGSPAACGRVLAFSTDKRLYAVDLTHGTRRWAQELVDPTPPVADGSRFVAMEGTSVTVFDGDSGTRMLSVDLSQQEPKSGAATNQAFVLTRSCIVASADGHNVYWIDKRSGKVLGHYTSPDQPWLFAADDTLFLLSSGHLFAFRDPKSAAGAMQPAAQVELQLKGTPAICADGGRLFVYDGGEWVYAYDVASNALCKPWNPPAVAKGSITGMAASKRANRLVSSTSDGRLLYWEYGSGAYVATAQIPDFDGAHVFAPVLNGAAAFCTAAAGDAGGGVFAFDLQTGALRGRDEVKSPPVGAPLLAAGTAYFACGAGKQEQPDANAMHSAVFGEMLALERRACDPPLMVALDAIHGRSADSISSGNFSIEAWINAATPAAAAELLSLAPVAGHAGFLLAVGAGGELTVEHRQPGNVSRFTSAPAAANDGHWHHVAAAFQFDPQQQQQLCHLYLDGKQLHGVGFEKGSDTAPADRRMVTIGGSGTSQFRGMLDEVRLWDTWLHAAEVSGRSNVRLRGDEPDLVACWRFTDSSVEDASLNKLGNARAGALNRWLTDLAFIEPSYPYLTASSQAVGQIVTETIGNGSIITSGQFDTTIKTCAAGGTPLDTTLEIELDAFPSSAGTVTISGVTKEDGHWIARTGPGGQTVVHLTIHVTHPDETIVCPSMRVRAGFMYANEKFVVSPVIDRQAHVTLPPPRLEAQSAMIQDFRYTTGDSLGTHKGDDYTPDAHFDITKIHTTITAFDGRNQKLPSVPLEIWASEQVTIECDGVSYPISAENSARLQTQEDGSLTLEFSDPGADGRNLLNTPTLSIHAAFMPRGNRFAVDPAENCHKTLATVNEKQVAGDQLLAPDQPATPKKRLVQQALVDAGKAGPVAALLNQMASLALKHEPARHFGAAAAPGSIRPADGIASIHHFASLRYDAPITPEYMPYRHSVFSVEDMTFKGFTTAGDLDDHLRQVLDASFDGLSQRGQYFEDDPAGGWLHDVTSAVSDAYDHVKHGAEHAWDKAKHVVTKTWDEVKSDVKQVAHFVEVVVVSEEGAIAKWVIKTVGDVVEHVVAFLKKIATYLKDLYEFLRALFDWKKIVAIHRVLNHAIDQSLHDLKNVLGTKLPDDVRAAFAKLGSSIPKTPAVAHGDATVSSYRNSDSDVSAAGAANTDSTKSRFLQGKIRKHSGSMPSVSDPSPGGDADQPLGPSSSLNDDFLQMVTDLQAIAGQPGGLTHVTPNQLLTLLRDFAVTLLDAIEQMVDGLLKAAAYAVGALIDALEAKIEMPFVSSFYKFITGDDLSLLDLLCLVLAVPVHVACSVIPNTSFEPGGVQAAIDGHRLFQVSTERHQRFSASPSFMGGTDVDDGVLKAMDVTYVVVTFFYGRFLGVFDGVQGTVNAEAAGEETPEAAVPYYKYIISVLIQILAIASELFLWAVRELVSEDSPVIRYGQMMVPFIHSIAALWGARFGAGKELYNNFKGIQIEAVLVLLGLGALFLIYELNKDVSDDYKKFEVVNDLLGAGDMTFQFLNLPTVAAASKVDGVPTSPLLLGAIDVAIIGTAQPVLHLTKGYGKKIW